MNRFEIELKITAPDGTEFAATEPVSARVVQHSPRGPRKALDEAVQLMAHDLIGEVVAKIEAENGFPG